MKSSSLSCRRPTTKDIIAIENLANLYNFELPKKFFEASVVENGEKVIAFGMLRTLAEAILVCNGSKREKAVAIEMLIAQAIGDARAKGFSDIHVFVEDENFCQVLKNKFGFRECKGTALILETNDGKK